MKKVYLFKNQESIVGYSIKIVDENGQIEVINCEKITDEDKFGNKWLVIPENPSNRHFMVLSKAEKIEGDYELVYKESRKIGSREKSKKVEEFMTEEEKKIVADIMKKCEERKKKYEEELDSPKNKKLREIERRKKEIEKLEKELAEME